MVRVSRENTPRICQGDILRDVEFLYSMNVSEGIIEVRKILFPAVIVLTQDCDLKQDHKFRTETQPTRDKWLISVLLAPMYNADHFFEGNHLSGIDINSQPFSRSKTPCQTIMKNQNPRYHYLEFSDVPLVPSVIDFKHYFSAPVSYLQDRKKVQFICTVGELFREDISQRFAAFLSRIGLPDLLVPSCQIQG